MALNMVDQLRIFCRFGLRETQDGGWEADPEGCSIQLQAGGAAAHEAVCGFALVRCTFAGCGAELRRSGEDAHDAAEGVRHARGEREARLTLEKAQAVDKASSAARIAALETARVAADERSCARIAALEASSSARIAALERAHASNSTRFAALEASAQQQGGGVRPAAPLVPQTSSLLPAFGGGAGTIQTGAGQAAAPPAANAQAPGAAVMANAGADAPPPTRAAPSRGQATGGRSSAISLILSRPPNDGLILLRSRGATPQRPQPPPHAGNGT